MRQAIILSPNDFHSLTHGGHLVITVGANEITLLGEAPSPNGGRPGRPAATPPTAFELAHQHRASELTVDRRGGLVAVKGKRAKTGTYQCPRCDAVLPPTSQALAGHIRNNHKKRVAIVKTFSCQYCSWSKRSTSPGVVAQHMRQAHPTKIKH